jgi:EmrB/QacA subfamily drug resistance transporter
MILARVVQEIGGAMVLPTTLSLVNANFEGKERGIAFAIWGSTIGGMVAIGPVLGGWLATDYSWRWAFNVNAPIGLLIVIGLLIFVRESKQAHREGGIDFVGAIISVFMFATLVFALIEGRTYGWWLASKTHQFTIGDFAWKTDGISIIPVALMWSVVFFIAFVMWERRRERAHKNVLLDLQLFKIASFRNGSIAALIISMGEFGLLFAIPLWLQNVEGLSAVSSGLVLLWLAVGAFLASGIGGALSGKLPAAYAVRIGVALEMVGVAGVALVASQSGGWFAVAPFLLVYGIGVGLATAQLTGVIMVDVPVQKIGQASGSQSTVRQIGSALGIAVLGSILFAASQSAIEAHIIGIEQLQTSTVADRQHLAESIATPVVESSGSYISGIAPSLVAAGAPQAAADAIQSAAKDGFTDGVKAAGWAAAGFLALGFVSTFNLGSKRRKPEEQAEEAPAAQG